MQQQNFFIYLLIFLPKSLASSPHLGMRPICLAINKIQSFVKGKTPSPPSAEKRARWRWQAEQNSYKSWNVIDIKWCSVDWMDPEMKTFWTKVYLTCCFSIQIPLQSVECGCEHLQNYYPWPKQIIVSLTRRLLLVDRDGLNTVFLRQETELIPAWEVWLHFYSTRHWFGDLQMQRCQDFQLNLG